MDFVLKTGRWIRALGRWSMQAPPVCKAAFVIFGAVIGASLVPGHVPPTDLDDRLRYIGLVFELLGILSVIRGLRDRQQLFSGSGEVGGEVQTVRSWLRLRPQWGVERHTILRAASMPIEVSASGWLSSWRDLPADADLLRKVAVLEENTRILRQDLQDTRTVLRRELARHSEAIASERRAREAAVVGLRTTLARLGVGGIHIEMAGVWWLMAGVALTTIPVEVACALKWGLGWLR